MNDYVNPQQPPHELTVELGRLLTTAQAAAMLGRPQRVVQRMIKDGRIPSRYRMVVWPYGQLILERDLVGINQLYRRKGYRRGRGITMGGTPAD